MSEIKCPYDLNQFILGEPIFENPFPEEECEKRKFYGDCYHCFSTAIASRDHQLKASVTAQPKIGKWIMSDDGLYRPICNNCGAHPWKGYIQTVEEATDVFKYCPNCGAKMQEVKI